MTETNSPDALLLDRGRQLEMAKAELRRAHQEPDGSLVAHLDKDVAARALFSVQALEQVIADIPAKTAAGLLLKAKIIWGYVNTSADDAPRSDWTQEETMTEGLMRDLEALAAKKVEEGI